MLGRVWLGSDVDEAALSPFRPENFAMIGSWIVRSESSHLGYSPAKTNIKIISVLQQVKQGTRSNLWGFSLQGRVCSFLFFLTSICPFEARHFGKLEALWFRHFTRANPSLGSQAQSHSYLRTASVAVLRVTLCGQSKS